MNIIKRIADINCFDAPNSDCNWQTSVLMGLLLIQVSFNPFPGPTAVSELAFYLSILVALSMVFSRKIHIQSGRPFIVPMTLYMLWAFVSCIGALNLQNSLHDIYAHWIKYLLFFLLLINAFSGDKGHRPILWAIVLSTTAFSLWEIIGYYVVQGEPLAKQLNHALPREIPTNVVGTLTVFGFLMGIWLFTISRGCAMRSWLLLCCSIMLVTTLLTQTRSSFLALITAIFILSFKSRKALLALAAIIALAFIIMPGRISPDALTHKIRKDDRVQIWCTYWEIIKDHPIKGVGFGMESLVNEPFLRKYNDRVPETYRNKSVYYAPHNLIVDTAVRTGLVGLAFFAYLLATYLYYGRRLYRHGKRRIGDGVLFLLSAFAALIIQGLFENTASGPPAVILFLIAALLVLLGKFRKESCNDDKTPAV